MFVVSEGYPYLIASFVLTVVIYYFFGLYWAVIPFVFGLYFAYFFRDEMRTMPYDADILYSPADGTVMGVEEFFDEEYLNEPALKLTIFLSVFNVHVNRSPIDGEIKFQRYTCGQFVPAYEKKASFENERHAIGLDNGRMKILVIQVAGLLARRIVSWVSIGHCLKQGERYGMIKFGSSTELVVPRNVEILVKKGDKVVGGVTVVGRLKQ